MKKVCRSITIPADLQEELSLVRRDINVSGVCTEALQRAVGQEPNYEDTRDKVVKRLMDENKKLQGLLKQVRGQRDAAQRKLDKFIAGVGGERGEYVQ